MSVNKVLQHHFLFLSWTIKVVALMSLQRIMMVGFFTDSTYHQLSLSNLSLFFDLLFQGFRFDLLVWGFFWIPIFVLFWPTFLLFSKSKFYVRWAFEFIRFYFGLIVSFVAVLSILDFDFFSRNLERITYFDWRLQGTNISWNQPMLSFGAFTVIGYLAILFLVFFFEVDKSKAKQSKISSFFERRMYLFCLLQFLLIALAARGTLTPHHLNIEHSLVSADPVLNELVLNSVWNWDK